MLRSLPSDIRPSVESLQIKVARVGFVVGSGSRAAPTPWHLTSRAGPEPDRPNRRNESEAVLRRGLGFRSPGTWGVGFDPTNMPGVLEGLRRVPGR